MSDRAEQRTLKLSTFGDLFMVSDPFSGAFHIGCFRIGR